MLNKEKEYLELEHLVRLRTEEIEQMNEELHTANDELLETNRRLEEKQVLIERQSRRMESANAILKKQTEKLASALENLKNTQTHLVQSEKMASLGQLTAGIAHEINNPINFIKAGIEALQSIFQGILTVVHQYDDIDSTNVFEKLELIKQLKQEMEFDELVKGIGELTSDVMTGVNRTTQIIKGLHTFSRLDENDFKPTLLHENIDSTLILLQNQIKNRIEIIKNYGEIPPVICQAGKLNQVFMNILANAIQAIPNEGKIFISTQELKENSQIQISIRDTGIGIPEHIRHRIFEPFFTTKEIGKGTGLGLSISYSIIEKHKGSIEVHSKENIGTTFIITLPIHH